MMPVNLKWLRWPCGLAAAAAAGVLSGCPATQAGSHRDARARRPGVTDSEHQHPLAAALASRHRLRLAFSDSDSRVTRRLLCPCPGQPMRGTGTIPSRSGLVRHGS
eukprot:1246771-Rhodomonas_salina.1